MQQQAEETVMTVDSLKNVLNEPPEIRKELETQKRKDLSNTFKTAPFEDLVSKAAARVSYIHICYFGVYVNIFL